MDYKSKCNAGSLSKGDLIQLGEHTNNQFRITTHPNRWGVNDGRTKTIMVELWAETRDGRPCSAPLQLGINIPVWRVTGARSAG